MVEIMRKNALNLHPSSESSDVRLMPVSLKKFYWRLRKDGVSRELALQAVKQVSHQGKYKFPSED